MRTRWRFTTTARYRFGTSARLFVLGGAVGVATGDLGGVADDDDVAASATAAG